VRVGATRCKSLGVGGSKQGWEGTHVVKHIRVTLGVGQRDAGVREELQPLKGRGRTGRHSTVVHTWVPLRLTVPPLCAHCRPLVPFLIARQPPFKCAARVPYTQFHPTVSAVLPSRVFAGSEPEGAGFDAATRSCPKREKLCAHCVTVVEDVFMVGGELRGFLS